MRNEILLVEADINDFTGESVICFSVAMGIGEANNSKFYILHSKFLFDKKMILRNKMKNAECKIWNCPFG